ncbi:MAG: hypothetical protein WCL13_02585, partial [bacterium]
HIALGALYFYIILTVFIIALLIFIILLCVHKNNFHIIKGRFLTAVLVIWLFFTLILVLAEVKWLAADYSGLIHKSQMDKAGFLYNKFAGDENLIPYLKFVKNNIKSGSTAFFVSPQSFDYMFAKYYLYPDIKLINGSGLPDYILLYHGDPAKLNSNLPLEIYKSLTPDKNILKIKI